MSTAVDDGSGTGSDNASPRDHEVIHLRDSTSDAGTDGKLFQSSDHPLLEHDEPQTAEVSVAEQALIDHLQRESDLNQAMRTRNKALETFEKGVFGIIHTIAQNNPLFSRVSIFILFIDFFQLVSFSFYPDTIVHASLYWWQLFTNFFQLGSLYSTADIYSRYVIVAFGLIAITIVLSIYVAWAFQKRKFNRMWPIHLLRGFVLVLTTVLFIPICKLFFQAMNCSASTGSVPSLMFVPAQPCFQMPHIVYFSLSILFSIVFIPAAAVCSLLYYDMNPKSLSNFTCAMPNARVEFAYQMLKLILCVVTFLIPQNAWARLAVLLFTTVFMTTSTAVFLPYYKMRFNQMRCAFHCAATYSAIFGFINYSVSSSTAVAPAVIYYIGMPICLVGGFFLPAIRYKKLVSLPPLALPADATIVDAANAMEESEEDFRDLALPTLWIQNDVEIATRFLQYRSDGAAISFAERIYQHGMFQFRKSPYVRLCYAQFIVNYTEESTKSSEMMKLTAHKFKPTFDLRFVIFARELDHEQRNVSDTLGHQSSSVDMIGYVEFQKLYKMTKHNHHETVERIQSFWKMLLKSEIDLSALAQVAERIENSEKRCTEAYAKLVERFPNNKKVVRSYGRFMEVVKNDAEAAHKYYTQAKQIEDSEARTKAKEAKLQLSKQRARLFIRKRSVVDQHGRFVATQLRAPGGPAQMLPGSATDEDETTTSPLGSNEHTYLSQRSTPPSIPIVLDRSDPALTRTNSSSNENTEQTLLVPIPEEARALNAVPADGPKKPASVAGSQSSKHSRQSNLSFNRKLKKFRSGGEAHDSVTRQLMMYFRVSFAVMFLLAVGTFVCAYMVLQTSRTNLNLANDASNRRFYALSVHMYARALVMSANSTLSGVQISFEEAQMQLTSFSTMLREVHRSLYQSAQASSFAEEVRTLDSIPSISIQEYVPGANALSTTIRTVNLWEAGNLLATSGLALAQVSRSVAANARNDSSDYRFIVDNCVYQILPALDVSVDLLVAVGNNYKWAQATHVTLMVVTVLLVLLLGVMLFRPLFRRIQEDRNITLNMFLQIPPHIINKILRKIKFDTTDESDHEEVKTEHSAVDAAARRAIKEDMMRDDRSQKSGGIRDDRSQKSGARDDRSQKSGADRSEKSLGSNAGANKDRQLENRIANAKQTHNMFAQLTLKYVFGLGLVAAMAIAFFIVAMLYVNAVRRPMAELNASGRRMLYARQIHINARELEYVPRGTTNDNLRNNMTALIRQLSTTSEQLRFPGTVFSGLDHRYGPQDTVNYVQSCFMSDSSQCLNASVDIYPSPCGLFCLLSEYMDQSSMLTQHTHDYGMWNNSHLTFISVVEPTAVATGLYQAQSMLLEEHQTTFSTGVRDFAILLGASIALFMLLFVGLFRPMVAQVKQESTRTLSMLMMIPTETIESVPAIRRFLMRNDNRAAQQLLRMYSSNEEQKLKLDGDKLPCIVTNDRGVIEFSNQEAANIFGYTPLQLYGQHICAIIPEPANFNILDYVDDDDDRVELPHHLLIPGQRLVRGQRLLQGHCKDQSVVTLHVDASEVQVGNKYGRVVTVVIFLELESKQRGPQVTISLPMDPMADADEFNRVSGITQGLHDDDDEDIDMMESPRERAARLASVYNSDTESDDDKTPSSKRGSLRGSLPMDNLRTLRRDSLRPKPSVVPAPADDSDDPPSSGSNDNSQVAMLPTKPSVQRKPQQSTAYSSLNSASNTPVAPVVPQLSLRPTPAPQSAAKRIVSFDGPVPTDDEEESL